MKANETFYYIFYFHLNFFYILLAIIYKIMNIISISFRFITLHLLIGIISIWILLKVRNKPGYLPKDDEKEKIERKVSGEKIEIANFEPCPILYLNLMPSNGCEKCHIETLPLRSHHCSICQRCVKTYDHHSFLLAGCVGENNRLKFIIYLFFQNLTIISNCYGIYKIMNLQITEKLIYFYNSMFFVMVFFFVIFLCLFSFHLFLLFTNQTTYELYNEEQCPYLSIFALERSKILNERGIIIDYEKINFKPFDIGILRNITLFFDKILNENSEIKWKEIYFENLKSTHINSSEQKNIK